MSKSTRARHQEVSKVSEGKVAEVEQWASMQRDLASRDAEIEELKRGYLDFDAEIARVERQSAHRDTVTVAENIYKDGIREGYRRAVACIDVLNPPGDGEPFDPVSEHGVTLRTAVLAASSCESIELGNEFASVLVLAREALVTNTSTPESIQTSDDVAKARHLLVAEHVMLREEQARGGHIDKERLLLVRRVLEAFGPWDRDKRT